MLVLLLGLGDTPMTKSPSSRLSPSAAGELSVQGHHCGTLSCSQLRSEALPVSIGLDVGGWNDRNYQYLQSFHLSAWDELGPFFFLNLSLTNFNIQPTLAEPVFDVSNHTFASPSTHRSS